MRRSARTGAARVSRTWDAVDRLVRVRLSHDPMEEGPLGLTERQAEVMERREALVRIYGAVRRHQANTRRRLGQQLELRRQVSDSLMAYPDDELHGLTLTKKKAIIATRLVKDDTRIRVINDDLYELDALVGFVLEGLQALKEAKEVLRSQVDMVTTFNVDA